MASLEPLIGQLGDRFASHLLRRTTFHINKTRIKTFSAYTVGEAVYALFIKQPYVYDQPIDPATSQPWIKDAPTTVTPQNLLRKYVRDWMLYEMRMDHSIHSKMLFFLHKIWVTHFDTSSSERLYDHFALLRHYTTGSYKALAKKMTLDNYMLIYLNNTTNNKNAPNENYAREFLELFTIGKGPQIGPGDYTNFTEADVVTGAMLLSGFKSSARGDFIDPDTGIATGRAVFNQHNTEIKTFSHAFDNTVIQPATNAEDMFRELDDYVEMVFKQEETARLYCRRLYRYFVSRKIDDEIENDIIRPLSLILINDQYQVENTLKTLLASKHFYDMDDSDSKDEVIGALIKSPLELYLQTTNYFEIPWLSMEEDATGFYRHLEGLAINVILAQGGLQFFAPSDVAGYGPYYQEPDYDKGWFSANTIISRYKLGQMLTTGRSYLSNTGRIGATVDMPKYISQSGHFTVGDDAEALVKTLLKNFFAEDPDEERIQYFLSIMLDDIAIQDWTYEWQNYLQTGDDTEVRIGLNNLFEAVLNAQEYQLL